MSPAPTSAEPPAFATAAATDDAPRRLAAFVARLLESRGGVVAALPVGGLEAVLPAGLQEELGLPELARLAFDRKAPAGAERIGLDPQWLARLGRAVGSRGLRTRCQLMATVPPIADEAELLADAVQLTNGIYRRRDSELTWTTYVLFALRYTARSDEQRQGLLRFGVNLVNGSPVEGAEAATLHAAALAAPAVPGRSPVPSPLPAPWSSERLATLLERGGRTRIAAAVAPFHAALERRLARDLARLRRYYGELAEEARGRGARPGEAQRGEAQLGAIAAELSAKTADLERRYALVVEVEMVQRIEVMAPVRRFHLLLKRRKGERPFSLDWCAVTRRFDTLPCEHSFGPAGPRVLCDEALHLLSPQALEACPGCSRPRCPLCHPRQCGRCERRAHA